MGVILDQGNHADGSWRSPARMPMNSAAPLGRPRTGSGNARAEEFMGCRTRVKPATSHQEQGYGSAGPGTQSCFVAGKAGTGRRFLKTDSPFRVPEKNNENQNIHPVETDKKRYIQINFSISTVGEGNEQRDGQEPEGSGEKL